MKVDVRHVDDVIIVDFEGRLVAGTGDELLREVINELLAEGWKKILLNLSQTTRIDSAGVGELVASYKLAHRFGSEVKIWLEAGRVRKVLELSRIVVTIDVYDNENEALADFAETDFAEGGRGDDGGGIEDDDTQAV